MSALPFHAVPEVDSPGSRQAALLLHGIGEIDRQWLLGELSTAQRAGLDTLLRELQTLGVPPSSELIDDVLGTRNAVRAIEEAAVAEAPAARALDTRLALVAPTVMAGVLHQEPDALVARVLRIANDRQRRVVVRQVGALRRRRIEECARVAGPPGENRGERLHQAILEALLRRTGDTARGIGFRAVVRHWLTFARHPARGTRPRSPGVCP